MKCGWGALSLLTVALTGCTVEPNVDNLRASFVDQIRAIPLVDNLERNGDFISFTRQDGSGEEVDWRVHIDSAVLEPFADEATPYRGIVESTWHVNDAVVYPKGNISGLPMWILDQGLSQDCWAFWEAEAKVWSWI